ncbi:Fluoroacetyl-CoA thioesterase [Aquisphaera giovannonii]|uniref:Fluoroacetyl-CoA thioesterase n=1 Tax=Aquisphaera giovannonii TaxID=406548 RepID=A0A5B9W8S4_9BACT|nr:thioesterase family protein [Aquisphaera giovannonii]QEH36913.1 Fluoroacetyl-CoA thioesterase [Aquisphaera giovannonii]
MRNGLKVGGTAERRFRVELAHAIDLEPGAMPPILSTPWLIWFLEHVAREALAPFLEEGENSVGSHVDVDHLAATPVGEAVRCVARVAHIDGRQVSFQLEAFDDHERIARGFHRRHVVRVDRLARRVEVKMRPLP